MRRKFSGLLTFMSLSLLFSLQSCGGDSKPQKYNEGITKIFCDEGFKSFMDEEIDVFEYQYPGAYIDAHYVTETEAINALLNDSTRGIIIGRKLSEAQLNHIKKENRLIAHTKEIAVDAVALIVNKENPVNTLSVDEISDILNGKISSWRQLAWNDTLPLKIVFDAEGSATVNYMRDKFLPKGGKFPTNTFAQKSNSDVFKVVEQDKNAIGIISVSWLGENLEKRSSQKVDESRMKLLQEENDTIAVEFTDKVKVLKVRKNDVPEGYQPYQAYINSGDYPLFRVVYYVSTASNGSVGHSFYSFVTGFIGQKILTLTGIMPYQVSKRIVELQ